MTALIRSDWYKTSTLQYCWQITTPNKPVLFKAGDFGSLHQVKHIGEDRYSIPMWFTTDKNYELKFAEK
jgi:hypothetical protein